MISMISSVPIMVRYKLIYLNGRGKAEVSRMLFHIAGEEFEDVRIENEEWPELKPKMPFGQVPVLEITNESDPGVLVLAQSAAIGRFLANKFDLAGKNDLEKAKADMFVDQLHELLNNFYEYAYYEKDDARKKLLGEKLFNEKVPQNLKFFENLLSKNQTEYLASNELTYADLTLINTIENVGIQRYLDDVPLIKALDTKVRQLPKVQTWLKERPLTDF